MFDRDQPPEDLAHFAAAVEEQGADDLWVVEDLSWGGSIASAALALAATSRLRVGIGIAPAPLRNPALLAMELATLARVFPGRLVAGIGHGVPEWMARVGAAPASPLTLLEETVTTVRTLLAGEEAEVDGRAVQVRGVRLVHPPAEPPPVVTGVVRPRSLRLSGRVADGTILAEGQGPRHIAAALPHLTGGREAAAVSGPHELIVFTHLNVPADPELTGPVLAEQAGWLGIPADEAFLAAGDPDTAAARIHELWHAGASTVVLRPVGPDPLGQTAAALAAAARLPGGVWTGGQEAPAP
ncbi:LLM class flavin-dependent oxidoreductase [Streptomyces marincola]|uniref:LLM class flavin-dependent oxidoreductase n=1 Tax=Streptomyces marincola TaxID=2878388 RepID=UPI001CF1C3DB|nr:LLM class flavin-dependent oxidoreductase [Streptomyces marincola]UCM91899.1 LLM class flavin-dependent oxidoreductase [Streptomyces marincola]